MTSESPIIFVVDDDLSLRRAVARLLRSAGYHVKTYESGGEFLAMAEAQPRGGCVVLDVRMSGLSGFDVVQCFAARGMALPVILITGDGDVPTAVRAMDAGCSSFLAKPFEDEILLDAVRLALQRQDDQAVE